MAIHYEDAGDNDVNGNDDDGQSMIVLVHSHFHANEP